MRTEVLQIRMTKEEKELYKKEADKLGLNMAGLIRMCIMREINSTKGGNN